MKQAPELPGDYNYVGINASFDYVESRGNGPTAAELFLPRDLTRRRIYKFITGNATNAADCLISMRIAFFLNSSLICFFDSHNGTLGATTGSKSLPSMFSGDFPQTISQADTINLLLGTNLQGGGNTKVSLRPFETYIRADKMVVSITNLVNFSSFALWLGVASDNG